MVFKALADRTRQRALGVLTRHELSVSELVSVLRQPQSTVSRHLKVLREAGLIRDRREGTTVMYSPATRRAEPSASGDGQQGQAGAHGNGNGNGAELTARLLDWLADQPLPRAIGSRLEATVAQRGDQSWRFFDRVGRQWDTLREESFGPCFHLEALIALLPKAWTVLDVGTGTGYMLPVLAGHFDRVIGVEPVENMLGAARHRVAFHDADNVELHRADITALPLADGSVDVATAMLVLHHVPSPGAALIELCRVIRPGGSALIVEQVSHDNASFHERMQDHWWGFDAEELGAMMSAAGFSDVRIDRLASVVLADDAPELFAITATRPEKHKDN